MIEFIMNFIANLLIAFFYVGLVVIGFWLFDMSLHTDIFTAAAIVAFVCAPTVGD